MNAETTKGYSHADIIQRYRDGMVEGFRILRPGGLMLVKCKDEIVAGQQKMSSIEIHNIAVIELGMNVEDQFVLLQPSPLLDFGRSPGHAKKNHSFLWVFRKPGDDKTARRHRSKEDAPNKVNLTSSNDSRER